MHSSPVSRSRCPGKEPRACTMIPSRPRRSRSTGVGLWLLLDVAAGAAPHRATAARDQHLERPGCGDTDPPGGRWQRDRPNRRDRPSRAGQSDGRRGPGGGRRARATPAAHPAAPRGPRQGVGARVGAVGIARAGCGVGRAGGLASDHDLPSWPCADGGRLAEARRGLARKPPQPVAAVVATAGGATVALGALALLAAAHALQGPALLGGSPIAEALALVAAGSGYGLWAASRPRQTLRRTASGELSAGPGPLNPAHASLPTRRGPGCEDAEGAGEREGIWRRDQHG